MKKIILKFLDEKYPDGIRCELAQSKKGMQALMFDIFCLKSNEKICRFIYYFETKKLHANPNPFLEVSLIAYFDVGLTEIEKVVRRWTLDKIPMSENLIFLKLNQPPL